MIAKIIILFLFSISFLYFSISKDFFQSKSGDIHQEFINTKKTPLLGGIILYFSVILFGFNQYNLFYLLSFLILTIGLLSDIKKIISPRFRFLLQCIVTLFSVALLETTVTSTNIHYLDYLLQNNILSILFTSFCIMILINGSNFIDGTNLLVIGYYFILSCLIFYFGNVDYLFFFKFKTIYLIITLGFLFILNSINKIYLGDGGSYLLGFIIGLEFIHFYNNNEVSPFFIVLLFWYPCYEILFSIFRKLNFNKSPLRPDSKHFHQLLYYYINKKFKNPILSSSLSGLFINIYNLIIFSISITNSTHTQFQIFLLIINLTVYSFLYLRLYKLRFEST